VPAKRRAVEELLVGHRGQSLVFTDFPGAAHALADHLGVAGVRAEAYTSRASAARRAAAVEAFTRGELPCLVLSGMARHGLNLQRADLVVHYDVPASASSATQRVGRAARIGSLHERVQVHTLVARGTVEQPLDHDLHHLRDGGDWLEAAARSVAPLREQARRCAKALEPAPGTA
jgi:superfamily II DNA/RNA helicase